MEGPHCEGPMVVFFDYVLRGVEEQPVSRAKIDMNTAEEETPAEKILGQKCPKIFFTLTITIC